jgi:hypothetical protein
MKKYLAGFFIIFSLGTFTKAQETKAPFDVKTSQEELEIMKGIISTKLSYVAEDSQKESASLWRFSNINAFYLSGQGAVFVIPTSSLRAFNFRSSSDDLGRLREQMDLIRMQMERTQGEAAAVTETYNRLRQMTNSGSGTGSGTGQGTGGSAGTAPPAAPAPPSPPSPQVQPFSIQAKTEEIQKREAEARARLSELQERSKKREAEESANREKFLQRLAEIKGYLIETLASYGDSLTTVKANDSINLVLLSDVFDGNGNYSFGKRGTRYDIISVQKSWITDYKAGRLNLEGFKQKALQYTE